MYYGVFSPTFSLTARERSDKGAETRQERAFSLNPPSPRSTHLSCASRVVHLLPDKKKVLNTDRDIPLDPLVYQNLILPDVAPSMTTIFALCLGLITRLFAKSVNSSSKYNKPFFVHVEV